MVKGARVRFSKGSEVRFLSHLDLLRTIERAIRRSKLPIAYSEGFHPKPKLAFASALSVGLTSSGEYADLVMASPISATEVQDRLNATLPQGFSVDAALELPEGASSLMSIISAASYGLTLIEGSNQDLSGLVNQLLASDSLPIRRETKKGVRSLDIRPMIYDLKWDRNKNQILLRCACGSVQNVRPTEIFHFFSLPMSKVLVHREELLVRKDDGVWITPLDVLK